MRSKVHMKPIILAVAFGFLLLNKQVFVVLRWRSRKNNAFVCPQGFPQPSVEDPGDDVTKLHPAHIRYVSAIGDSITAGFAAQTLPLEFRGLSFAGGVGQDEHHTLQWLLRHYDYREEVTGGSVGVHYPLETSSKDPYRYAQDNHLNVAVSSARTEQFPMQMARLKNQTLQDNGGWMVVTIFLGENDLCRGHEESCGTPEMQQSVVDKFQLNIEELLKELIAWRKKLYINLVQLFWMSSVAKQQSWRCEVFEKKFHVCPCLRHGNVTENAAKIDSVTDRMNRVLENLAAKYDLIRPDIGVNVVRTFNRVPVPDLSFLSRLDCFHPSAKTHQLTAHSVWNSMLRPSKPTPMSDASAFIPLCANATSRLMTWRDQPDE